MQTHICAGVVLGLMMPCALEDCGLWQHAHGTPFGTFKRASSFEPAALTSVLSLQHFDIDAGYNLRILHHPLIDCVD